MATTQGNIDHALTQHECYIEIGPVNRPQRMPLSQRLKSRALLANRRLVKQYPRIGAVQDSLKRGGNGAAKLGRVARDRIQPVARKISDAAVQIPAVLSRPYEWWYNLSTRRRARRRGQKANQYARTEQAFAWESHCDLPSEDRGEEEDDAQLHRPRQNPRRTRRGRSHGRAYGRGQRAYELASAIELKFTIMPYNRANYIVAHRYASRHELAEQVTNPSDRIVVVKKALLFYFTRSEDDMVMHYGLSSKKNRKYEAAMGLTAQ